MLFSRSLLGLAACAAAVFALPAAPALAGAPDCRAGPRDVPICAFGDASEPNVLVALIVGAGAADEGEGEAGAAHYLEHLIFRDHDGHGAREGPGASLAAFGNAYTTHAVTTYHWTVPRSRAREALERALSVLDTPDVPAPVADGERRIVLREHEEARGSVGARLSLAAWAALLDGTPLARAIDGTRADVLALDTEGALAFHAAHYRPRNAILITSGPLTTSGARPDETGARVASPRLPAHAHALSKGRAELARTDPAAGVASRWWLAATDLRDGVETRAALILIDAFLNSRLDGAPHSPLARRSEQVKDFGAGAFLRADGVGVLEAWADLRPGLDMAALHTFETAWTGYLADLAARGLSPETIARLKRRAARAIMQERGQPISNAWSLVGWLEDGRTMAEWTALPATLDRLAPGAVNAVLHRLADPARTVVTDRLPPS